MKAPVVREILLFVDDFKAFWKSRGPFVYALTSREYPPVLLEPEEWIFSNDLISLLKELMQWDKRKMRLVEAPFNPKRGDILRPDDLGTWRIANFPEEWESAVCDSFTPKGHLTSQVTDRAVSGQAGDIEAAFFDSLARDIERIGYVLLRPEPAATGHGNANIVEYVKEWEEDE